MPIALQVALIGAVAALVGALISFLSSLLNHWYDRNSKVSSWLFDGRVDDIQELISAFDSFNKELAIATRDTRNAYIPIYVSVITVPESFSADDWRLVGDSFDADLGRSLEEAAEKAKMVRQQTRGFTNGVYNWNSFDVDRLTTWLDDSQTFKVKCHELSLDCMTFYSKLQVIQIKLTGSSRQYPTKVSALNEAQKQELISLQEDMNAYEEEQRKISQEIVDFQRLLAVSLTSYTDSFWTFITETLFNVKK